MSRSWYLAMVAGMAVATATPAAVDAQLVTSSRSRQNDDRDRDRDRDRRDAERERMRRIEQAANARGIVLRRNDRDDRDDRYGRNSRNDRYDRDRDDRYDRRRYDPWGVNNRNVYDRRGPAFCRSGEGHPRYGRAWCRQKGFGLGYEPWRNIWGDINYRNRRYDNRLMNRSYLESILGLAALNRFDSYGRTYYGNGSLGGRWMDNRMGVLQLYMGSVPIARLIDTNFDGRVDAVSLLR